jgi:acetoin utilization deacetylase AcuC-like enzyme
MSPSESVLQLSSIVAAMKPPNCWGSVVGTPRVMGTPDRSIPPYEHVGSTPSIAPLTSDSTGNLSVETVLEGLLSGLPVLQASLCKSPPRHKVIVDVIADFLSSLHVTPVRARSETIPANRLSLFRKWACLRSFGEDITGKSQTGDILHEWRVASERIYRYFVKSLGPENKTLVLTDWRCNGHVTNGAAFERCVRLPAALKGARLAGLGKSEKLILAKSVSDKCIDYVESTLLMKAHEIKYLDKIKARCNASQSHEDVFMLTEDSEGNGGHDTRGSRGTWKASVCAVAAAVTAVDGVVNGECVNAFCATRPPGHHAGRALHPMKAVSNGFCVLNPAACAAIHATTPVSEGGCGLRRVCVIDFDVHHGNGTQDILCSTYDARFLYVSIHAGGSLVNGLSLGDDLNGFVKAPCANKSGGIYPGRCGDTSPHAGVLNIPLGQRVTPHDVGSALINRISPAVEAFSPNLIILSAGFDAHKHDPMGLGTLSAEDFGHITEVACQLAFKMCSGRLVSILEGGYGIPCCRVQKPTPTPAMNPSLQETSPSPGETNGVSVDPERAFADETNGNSGSLEQVPVTRQDDSQASNVTADGSQPETKVLDLGDGMPEDMDDQLPQGLPRRLDKCHLEGFIDCVKEHVSSLAKCNVRK